MPPYYPRRRPDAEGEPHGSGLPPLHDEFYRGQAIEAGTIRDDHVVWLGMCAYRHYPGTSCEGGGYADHMNLQVVVDAMRGHRERCHPGARYPEWSTLGDVPPTVPDYPPEEDPGGG